MPKSRERRGKPDDGLDSPEEGARLWAELEPRILRLRRMLVKRKWRIRQKERAAGRPSIGFSLDPFPEPKPIIRYGTNNPLRYQETSKDPPRLDLKGSRL